MPKIDLLFQSYDAGHFDLPAELLSARHAVQRLVSSWPVTPPTADEAREDFISDTVRAAREDDDLPEVHIYLDAAAAHTAWATANELHDAALRAAEAALRPSQGIVEDHLRPALAEVVERLATLSSLLPPEPSDAEMARPATSAKVRAAWHDLDDLARRYRSIRAAQTLVSGHVDPDSGEFAEMSNLTTIWPGWVTRKAAMGNVVPPWPTEARARLLWLYRAGADLVVLTADERVQMHEHAYGAERDRLAGSTRAARSMISGL